MSQTIAFRISDDLLKTLDQLVTSELKKGKPADRSSVLRDLIKQQKGKPK